MIKILRNPAQIITVNTDGKNVKRGKELSQINILHDHSLLIEDDLIKDILPDASIKYNPDYEIIDLKNKIVLPGIVECHTHTAFAGSRANEFRKRISGTSYEDIALEGGGINTTVQAVRKTSFEDLIKIISPRIQNFISQGVTTLEIKSGYGLDFENEIKLLKVIKYLNEIFPIDIISTFLGAHTFPLNFVNNHDGYINDITEKMIPFISKNNLAEFCDGFCEATAFSADEIDHIFTYARSAGLKIKLHTEQFNNIGGVDTALKHKAVSVDHLEVVTDTDLKKLSSADTTAVLLPGVSFFLDYNYAPAVKLINSGAAVALATDYNPGSSNIANIGLIMSLASIKMKMKIEEVISAYTINAAKALGLQNDRGSIELNKKADFAVFNTEDYADLIYNVAENKNCITIKNGNVIYSAADIN